jgi:hypothetical protein
LPAPEPPRSCMHRTSKHCHPHALLPPSIAPARQPLLRSSPRRHTRCALVQVKCLYLRALRPARALRPTRPPPGARTHLPGHTYPSQYLVVRATCSYSKRRSPRWLVSLGSLQKVRHNGGCLRGIRAQNQTNIFSQYKYKHLMCTDITLTLLHFPSTNDGS